MDPSNFTWVEILGSKFPSRNMIKSRMKQFVRKESRPRAGRKQEALLTKYKKAPHKNGTKGLSELAALTRSGRKKHYLEQRRTTLGR